MPGDTLFDIHQVIESHFKSDFVYPRGWLKELLFQKFEWVETNTLNFIIQSLLKYYIHLPTRIPLEWIVHSLGVSIATLPDSTLPITVKKVSQRAQEQRITRLSRRMKQELSAITILLKYPLKLLQTLEKEYLGIPTQDYGGQFEVLQFDGTSSWEGKVTLGLVYENDQKIKAYGPKRCIKSEVYSVLLEHIQSDLLYSTKIQHDTSHLRCQFIKGARTMQHTDSFRGNMESYLMPLGTGFTLFVRLWPNFKCSVIEIDGFYCIPFLFDSDGFCVLNFEVYSGSSNFRKIMLPRSDLQKAKPIGDLPFVVVGPKGTGLQIAPMKYKIETSPKNYAVISMQEAKEKMIPNSTIPHRTLKVITKQFEWGSFIAWRNIHWANGNFSCPCLSIFFRPLCENPTGANMANVIDLR